MNKEPEEDKNKSQQAGCGGCAWTVLVLLLLVGGTAFAWWRGYLPQAWLPDFAKAKAAETQDGGKDGGAKGAPGGDSAQGGGKPGAGGGAGGGGGKRGRGAGGPVPVVVTKARKGDLPIYLNALGTVTALNTVTLHTRVDGELQQVLYKEGQHVQQGDLLAVIDPRPFQAQLEQAQGQLAKDQASLVNSKLDLQRYVDARAAVTQQQIDTAKATVGQFEGALATDQGQVDNAQLQLTYSHIISPIPGVIGLRQVDQGNVVHAADTGGLAVITQITPITAIFNLPETNLPQILKGSADGNKLPAEAWDRDMKVKIGTGSLLAVDSQIDPTTGTIRCRASFENKDEALFPNQFVNVRLLVDTRKDVVLVPLAALQHSPQADFVYIVKDDQTVEMRPVKTGTSESEQLILEEGVNPGETVVTEGVDKLQPGAKVIVPDPNAPKGAGQHGGHKGGGYGGGAAAPGGAAPASASGSTAPDSGAPGDDQKKHQHKKPDSSPSPQ